MSGSLAGKAAPVTGPSRGIGRASALARAGAQVFIHYGRGHPGRGAAEAAAVKIRDAGGPHTLAK